MTGLILKIIARFLMGVVALSAGLALVVVLLVFTRGADILHDHTFIATMEIVGFFIPLASAIFVIPSAIREHREGRMDEKHKIKSAFWEPPE